MFAGRLHTALLRPAGSFGRLRASQGVQRCMHRAAAGGGSGGSGGNGGSGSGGGGDDTPRVPQPEVVPYQKVRITEDNLPARRCML